MALTALALAFGAASRAPSVNLRRATPSADARAHTGARVYVVGSLARPGDVSSFVARRGIAPIADRSAARGQVHLVVAPEGIDRGAIATPSAIQQAQSRGELYVLETAQVVSTRGARVACAQSEQNSSRC